MDDKTLLEDVLEQKLEDLKDMDPGSKEQNLATSDIKMLGEMRLKELEIYYNDVDKTERRAQDYAIKKEELDFRKEELEFKKQQFEQELKSYDHQVIIDKIKVGLEAATLGLSAFALGIGYKFEYKFNGVATGTTFKGLRSAVEKLKRH